MSPRASGMKGWEVRGLGVGVILVIGAWESWSEWTGLVVRGCGSGYQLFVVDESYAVKPSDGFYSMGLMRSVRGC